MALQPVGPGYGHFSSPAAVRHSPSTATAQPFGAVYSKCNPLQVLTRVLDNIPEIGFSGMYQNPQKVARDSFESLFNTVEKQKKDPANLQIVYHGLVPNKRKPQAPLEKVPLNIILSWPLENDRSITPNALPNRFTVLTRRNAGLIQPELAKCVIALFNAASNVMARSAPYSGRYSEDQLELMAKQLWDTANKHIDPDVPSTVVDGWKYAAQMFRNPEEIQE